MTYREGAEKYYDLFGANDDESFNIDLAKEHGGKALELCVGTARLAMRAQYEHKGGNPLPDDADGGVTPSRT